MDAFDQHGYRVCLEWGPLGIDTLAPRCAVLVVVDVLSFSTTVDIAVSHGARVLPLRSLQEPTPDGAVLVGGRSLTEWSLSPASLVGVPAGTTLALTSLNGAWLTVAAGSRGAHVLAGCLRNAAAVAAAAAELAGPDGVVGVVPAGERWRSDRSLRPSVEDLLGAGAVVTALAALGTGGLSPEAVAAADAFSGARMRGLADVLWDCSSGRELVDAGFAPDVKLAADYGVSTAVPLLADGVYSG